MPARFRRFIIRPATPCFASIAVAAASSIGFAQAPSAAMRQADPMYRAGTAALAQHDLATAQADFEQVIHLVPNFEPGHSALGAVLLNRGDLQGGIHELQIALTIRKNDSNAQLNLAIAYEQTGQPAKALALFHQIDAEAKLQHRPLSASILSMYAHALAASGNLPQATAELKAAAQADPRNAQLHDDLGSLYAQQKSWPEAEREFHSALQLNAHLAAAHLHLGLALEAQNKPGSLDELQHAQQLAPSNAIVAFELGKALAAAGHDDQAIPLFRQVVDHEPGGQHPETLDATVELALALQRSNHATDAIELFRKVLAAQPDNALVATNLGMALTQAQLAEDAVPVLQHAVALAPDNITAHQDLAAAYVQLNQFDDAETELHAAIQLAPDISQLHYDLGLAYKMQDDATRAIPELETAEKLDATQPEASYALGLLYLQAGRYADAARELKTSLTLRPQNGEGWATLGSVYAKLNQLHEANAALLEAIKQLPSQPDPHLTLADVFIKQNKLTEATEQRKLAANLMRTNMNRQRADVATNSGKALLKSGDLAGAIVQFHDALSFDPTCAEAHEGLAQVYDAQGKPVDAAAERAKANQTSPDATKSAPSGP